MQLPERIAAVVNLGFTKRQARFFVLVMQHSGVCLLRQYIAFAGIVHGQKTRNFFAKLVGRRFATAHACRHNRGRIYHVQHKAVYRAIGETDSRLRRPLSTDRIVIGLATLDALLAHPEVDWLATAQDKAQRLSVDVTSIQDRLTLPKGCTRFAWFDGVLVTEFACAAGLANVLRLNLVKLAQTRSAAVGKCKFLEPFASRFHGLLTDRSRMPENAAGDPPLRTPFSKRISDVR